MINISTKKIKIDLKIVLLVNLDFGGFLTRINIIIVAQNRANILQPVIKA